MPSTIASTNVIRRVAVTVTPPPSRKHLANPQLLPPGRGILLRLAERRGDLRLDRSAHPLDLCLAQHALVQQPRLEQRDRIAPGPLVYLGRRAIQRSIGRPVAAQAVRSGLDERGAIAAPSAGDRRGHDLM